MSKKFIILNTILREGGFSDNPYDTGGKTMYGITKRTARNFGYTGNMKDLSLEKAIDIYDKGFWQPIRLDSINDSRIQELLFDARVNHSPGVSVKTAQRAFNMLHKEDKELAEDGLIGSQTIGALNNYSHGVYGKEPLIDAMLMIRGQYFRDIVENREAQTVFIVGWLRRLRKLRNSVGFRWKR